MKIRPLGTEPFHVDMRMDEYTGRQTNSRFSKFCELVEKQDISKEYKETLTAVNEPFAKFVLQKWES
jgi:hypothetical protein